MSVYIKGMKLPTDEPRRLVIYPDGRIYDAAGFFRIDATAEQLPPHGRLIDADALENEGADVHQDIEYCGYVEDTIYGFSDEMIENAPTIIPADPEEGGTDG